LAQVSEKEIRAALAGILASSTFANAPMLSRFLKHVVEHTIDGAADQLKEYSLGVEVFDRGPAFDPRTDTIVRVQARRLRGKLKDYYSAAGQFDPVLIEVPTGRYAALFTARPTREDIARPATSFQTPRLFAPPADTFPHLAARLPVPWTPLIGRERELDEIKMLLHHGHVRLLTLTGAGGSGKTRLAIEAARDLAESFPGGVHLLSLAPLTDSTAVATALAHILGLRQTGGKPLADALLEYVKLSIYSSTLLVLDNFEHVLAAAPLVASLLESSPNLKIVVTSRAVLHVYGEQEYPVPPLLVPEPARSFDDVVRNAAVRLFVERAQAANRAFQLTAGNADAVAEICRRLDGLPLAIELAAPRSKMFPAEAIVARLGHALDFLTGGARDLPARQQTLRNTLDWSHALLNAEEQRLFRRLAVFAGGWTLEGAEAVCDAARDLGISVVDGVRSLVDKSLVVQAGAMGGEARFDMLETLRQYAREQLAITGDERLTRRAHAAYCIVLAEEGNPHLTATEREAWLSRCDVEDDNFRAALDWLVEDGDAELALRLGLALFGFWERREHLVEGLQRLLAILKLGTGQSRTAEWTMAITYAGALSSSQGDYAMAQRLHKASFEASRQLGDRKGVASALNNVAALHRYAGEHAQARSYFEQSLAVCREIGQQAEIAAALSNLADVVSLEGDEAHARALFDQARIIFCDLGDEVAATWVISHLGDVARHHGHLEEAQRLYQQALDAFSRLGDLWGTARSCADLAYAMSDTGDDRTAHALFSRALTTFLALDHKRGMARVLEGFAYLAQHRQDFRRALTLAGAATAVRDAFGAAPRPSERTSFERVLAPAWQSLDHAAAAATWGAGRRMSLNEAVRYAIAPSLDGYDS
jgi:predicted ATPase